MVCMSESPVVLIVEDEPDIAGIYELWLQDSYEVHLATTGKEALTRLDDTEIDVVLLDRMMPQMSGGVILAAIREREIDCRVAMVTAVDPDFDIIEMGFDEYITKPPVRDELHDTVERLLDRATLNDGLQEYYSLVSKRSALQSKLSDEELNASDEYAELVEHIESHRTTVDDVMGDMASDTEFVGAVRELMNRDHGTDESISPDDEREDPLG